MTRIDYADALRALLELEYFGMKLGLENIRALLEELGNPQDKINTIHVAGTNGKGSVCAMLATFYRSRGKKVGLFTSPHLVDYRERIRINGEKIAESDVIDFVEQVWRTVKERKMTFFEVTTALAFWHFELQQVDIAIIETGLGGRLDATNVLKKPLATIITSIGMDHMQQLGDSLEAIATEKAGIFKANVPAIANVTTSLQPLFLKHASAVGAPIHFVDQTIEVPHGFSETQTANLQTVITALSLIEPGIDPAEIFAAIPSIEATGLLARLEDYASPELESKGVSLLLDVAHNPAAFEHIAQHFIARGVRPTVILGLMKDKEHHAIMWVLASFANRVIAVEPQTPRALSSSELTEIAESAGLDARDGGPVLAGLQSAINQAGRRETLLLTGSHYVVGEFLANEQALRGV